MACDERAISSQLSVKPNMPTPTRLGPISGSSTWRKLCQGVAPRSRAASS
jgi:hypothetical protein